MHLTYNNVNDAFSGLVEAMHLSQHRNWVPDSKVPRVKTVVRQSRYGDVLMIPEPVTVTYRRPEDRVLFNPIRDCNPFFHVYESLWMLAGRNDVACLAYFNSRMSEFSDDGKLLRGSYGHRWRSWFGYDQLDVIVRELRVNPDSRRCVLSMWYATGLPGTSTSDLHTAVTPGSKDVPCNTHAYFLVNDGKLDMTVCNRSNDLVWGMLGANIVHLSFLQEYLAAHIGIPVGLYHQFTNNLHVYVNRWTPVDWLRFSNRDYRTMHDQPIVDYPLYQGVSVPLCQPLDKADRRFHPLCNVDGTMLTADTFYKQVQHFVEHVNDLTETGYSEPFLEWVAKPMMLAFHAHKRRNYDDALNCCDSILASDWKIAAHQWIDRRRVSWENRQGEYCVNSGSE